AAVAGLATGGRFPVALFAERLQHQAGALAPLHAGQRLDARLGFGLASTMYAEPPETAGQGGQGGGDRQDQGGQGGHPAGLQGGNGAAKHNAKTARARLGRARGRGRKRSPPARSRKGRERTTPFRLADAGKGAQAPCGGSGRGAFGRPRLPAPAEAFFAAALPAGRFFARVLRAGAFFAGAFFADTFLPAALRAGTLPPRRRSSAVSASTRAFRPSRSSLPGTPRRFRARCTRSSNTFSRRSQVSTARSRTTPTRSSTASRTASTRPVAS